MQELAQIKSRVLAAVFQELDNAIHLACVHKAGPIWPREIRFFFQKEINIKCHKHGRCGPLIGGICRGMGSP